MLAELVYYLPAAAEGGVVVELMNDFLLVVCYAGLIVALQANPHLAEETSRPQRLAVNLQAAGTILFVGTLFTYFSLIPIYFDPPLYMTLVPSMVMFVVLDIYLAAVLIKMLRETRSLRWALVYGIMIVAEVLWVFADTGEGLVYYGAIAPTTAWAGLVSTIAVLAKLVAARLARIQTERQRKPGAGARQELAGWNGRLVVFACFVPAMHVGLENRYQETREQLFNEQLESVGLREPARAEEIIQHTQRLESLGVLAGGIAHDFNNILMCIVGNADLALSRAGEKSPTRTYMEEIIGASKQATTLANQMLAYAGRGQVDIRNIDLNQVVRDITTLLRSSIHKSSELKLDLASELPPITADSAHIQQLAMNLVTNASEAIGKRTGTITVTTGLLNDKTSTSVFLEVRDTGSGMDEETRRRMFEPFYSTKSTGRGLGLSAVLGMVESQGGHISVDSTLGVGSTIRVVFAATDFAQVSDAVDSGHPVVEAPVNGKVLVIDDDTGVRKIVCAVLETNGWQVASAADGQAGLDNFRDNTDINAVVLDLTMPGKSGTEVLEEMHRLRPDVPVVLMSGFMQVEIEKFVEHEKAVRFLHKPFLPDDLLDELAQAINSPI